jgi:glycosyltransferase involved in cell wall biosynthesis
LSNAVRIGIDVTAALTQGGGIGRYVRELIRALATADSETEFQLFSAKPPATFPVPDPLPQSANFTHKPAPLNESWLYRLWYRARMPLPVQMVTGALDLFHSPDFVLPPVAGKIPTLLTVHDLSFIHYPHVYEARLVNYLNKVVPWSVRRATHILADSQATKDDLIQFYDTPDQKISVLYSGVSDDFQPVSSDNKLLAMRKKYHLGSKPFILTVGTVQPRKNYELLVRAFAKLDGDFTLAIAGGKGWLERGLAAEIATHNLEKRVKLLGFVDDADLPALYSAATLFVMPSLYEGFGIPILEAMACGVPVISSDRSSLPEVVGNAGILLPPDDVTAWTEAMRDLLQDPSRRAQMVGQGAIRAHRFTWQRAAIQLQLIYKNLLENSR